MGRGETTAVSSNGSFRARRRPPIAKELIAMIVLPMYLPLCTCIVMLVFVDGRTVFEFV